MIRFSLPCSLLLLAGLTACGRDSLEPAGSAFLRTPALPAAVAAGTDNDVKVTAHQPVIVPCGRLGQEIVPFDGTEHVLFHTSTSASGLVHVKLQTNAQGMTGIGLVSGDLYRLGGGTQDAYQFDLYSLPYTNTYINNFHIESAGATGNIIAHETLRVYVDENGVPSVQTVNFIAECKNFAA